MQAPPLHIRLRVVHFFWSITISSNFNVFLIIVLLPFNMGILRGTSPCMPRVHGIDPHTLKEANVRKHLRQLPLFTTGGNN